MNWIAERSPAFLISRRVQKSGLAVGAISFEILLAFTATCLVIEVTPGPNMAYLAVLSASKGRRAGFAATLGIALGLLIVGLAAALGLTAIITNSRWVYEALRWGGVSICYGSPGRAGVGRRKHRLATPI
jgi:hypothetical protein